MMFKTCQQILLLFITGEMCITISSHNTHKLCDDLRNADEVICQKIVKPTVNNREKVFSDIDYYLTTLRSLHEALQTKKDWIIDICRDILLLGTARFMKIRFDQEYLIRGFNWTNKEMNKYLDLRDDSLTEWIKMEPYLENLHD